MGIQMRVDSAGGQGVEGSRGVVWGYAAFPKGKAVGEGGRLTLLNAAEQVFAEVRQWVEGRRYERTEAKKAAGEGVLRGLEAGGRSHCW
jgi:hypothetical protein